MIGNYNLAPRAQILFPEADAEDSTKRTLNPPIIPNYTKKILIVNKSPTADKKKPGPPGKLVDHLDGIKKRRADSYNTLKVTIQKPTELSTSNKDIKKQFTFVPGTTKNRVTGEEKKINFITNHVSTSKSPVKPMNKYTISNSSQSPTKFNIANGIRESQKGFRIRNENTEKSMVFEETPRNRDQQISLKNVDVQGGADDGRVSPRKKNMMMETDSQTRIVVMDQGSVAGRLSTHGNYGSHKSGIRGVRNYDELRDHRNYIIDKKMKGRGRSTQKGKHESKPNKG